jgi:predicted site-specific integrase-resolvase
MKLVPLRKAIEALGLSKDTLRKYADTGVIKSVRTPAGQRLFDLDSFAGTITKQTTVAYARVSSAGQKPDLERQAAFLSEFAEEVVKDVASGLNYKRKGLRAILERAIQGERIKLVVAHRDRLARFGWELITFVIEKSGGEVVVLDKDVGSAENELTKDLLHILHILHVFSCRMYGQRKYKASEVKENPYLSHYATEDLVAEVVRRLKEGL